jgi:indolepyruvate ferredoxin oxidoreductase beta subunit
LRVLRALVPQKTIEVNLRAFEMGRRKAEESEKITILRL